MKKLIVAFALVSVFFSCKKVTTTPTLITSGKNTTDTIRTSNDESISGFYSQHKPL